MERYSRSHELGYVASPEELSHESKPNSPDGVGPALPEQIITFASVISVCSQTLLQLNKVG